MGHSQRKIRETYWSDGKNWTIFEQYCPVASDNKTYRVGVIAGIVNSPHTSAILNEIEKLKIMDILFLFSVLTKMDKTKENMWSMISKWVNGMLITIPGNTEGQLIFRRIWGPVVTIGENSGVIQSCVATDKLYSGALWDYGHLIKTDVPVLRLLRTQKFSDCQRERRNERIFRSYGGLWNSCKTGICCSGELYLSGDIYRDSWAVEAMKTNSCFCYKLWHGVWELWAIYDLGVRIPEQLSVNSIFDDF